LLVEQWRHYERNYAFQIHAYSILPDHYHVVLNVGKEKTISQILHAVHSYTTTLINQRQGRSRKIRIWQGNAWDEVIRDETMYWQKVAYTLLNPWREGLVEDPLTPYAFSNLKEWIDQQGVAFLSDLFARHSRPR